VGRVAALSLLGFAAGALIGFVYGQAARSRVSDSVSTDVQGGKVVVAVDVGRIAAGGLSGYINKALGG